MAQMLRQKYTCTTEDCGAKDEVKRFEDLNPTFPHVLNCWKCGAGRGLKIPQMLQERVGMFPVTEVPAQ